MSDSGIYIAQVRRCKGLVPYPPPHTQLKPPVSCARSAQRLALTQIALLDSLARLSHRKTKIAYKHHTAKTHEAAIAIQAMSRGLRGRLDFKICVAKEEEALVVVQALIRGKV